MTPRSSTTYDYGDGRGPDEPFRPQPSNDIPERYQEYTLDDFPKPIKQRVFEFLNEPNLWSMFLSGGVGTRKTTLAAAVLMAARLQPGMSGRFVPAYTAARVFRQFETGTLEQFRRSRLLILDDIGAARSTPHLTEQLVLLLQNRYDHRLKTIITSNLTLDEFAEHLDNRIASRLQEGVLLALGNRDSRKKGK